MDNRDLPEICTNECVGCIGNHGYLCRQYTWILDEIKALRAKYDQPNKLITGETSDGYHTFNELYHHRAILFSVICNNNTDRAWKSKKHDDGSMFENMFIIGINTPEGQATYHYDVNPYWDMFKVKEHDKAPVWDGHTPAQAIERIKSLFEQPNEPLTLDELKQMDGGKVWYDGNAYKVKVCSDGDVQLDSRCRSTLFHYKTLPTNIKIYRHKPERIDE